jgi:hypothetical protein
MPGPIPALAASMTKEKHASGSSGNHHWQHHCDGGPPAQNFPGGLAGDHTTFLELVRLSGKIQDSKLGLPVCTSLWDRIWN